MKRAVITGPTGAIGMALMQALQARGVQVYAVLRPDSPRAARILAQAGEGVVPVYCALDALDTLPALLAKAQRQRAEEPEKPASEQRGKQLAKKASERTVGYASGQTATCGQEQAQTPSDTQAPEHSLCYPIDAFFHFAWENTFGAAARNDMDSQIRNVRHTIEAVRVAKVLGCGVFLGAGSQAEYGRVEGKLSPETPAFPENGYGMAKLCAGQMSRVEAQSLGMRHVWARILSVYGPYDGAGTMVSSVLRTLLQGETPACTQGEQLWDFLYSTDAAQAFVAMAERGRDGAVYVLGSGQAQPLRAYLETMRDAVNPALTLGLGVVPYAPKQVMHLQADLAALTRDTGFAPRTAFADGIADTIVWMREEQT